MATKASKTDRGAPSHEQAVLRLAARRSILRARDVTERGVPPVVLSRLVQDGKLDRIARGLYALSDHRPSESRSLIEVGLRVPKGVICLLSALRVHGIGTQSPSEVWIAIPHGTAPPRLDRPRLRIARMSGEAMHSGIQHVEAERVRVPVFSLEKTIADCFKFRHKIGLDVALEALREGRRERKVDMDTLWHHAAVDRVANVIRPYLHAIAMP